MSHCSGREFSGIAYECEAHQGYHLREAELFPRALFLHLADKAKPLARKRTDQNLPLAVVTDGVANRGDLAAKGRFRNDTAAPDRGHQVILADDAFAISDEV